jgi:hypothetical protein
MGYKPVAPIEPVKGAMRKALEEIEGFLHSWGLYPTFELSRARLESDIIKLGFFYVVLILVACDGYLFHPGTKSIDNSL